MRSNRSQTAPEKLSRVPIEPRAFLAELFQRAVRAVDPARIVPSHLPPQPKGRTLIIGAGKASAAMAKAVEDHWQGPLSGIVITRYGHGVPCRSIEIIEAGHPLPDSAGSGATARIMQLLHGLMPDDLVLALISGGGSALLVHPQAPVTLSEKQTVTRALLASGAEIGEINCVRKHLSAVKGGRLARATAPARVHALILSDVAGDDLSVVASGPTVPDPTTQGDARAVLGRYRVEVPKNVEAILANPLLETPKPGDAAFIRVRNEIVGSGLMALRAAAEIAEAAGVRVIQLGDQITGEARDVAAQQATLAKAELGKGPAVILSGGETTVTLQGKGRGGRNTEFGLGLALALRGEKNIWAITCDTDGIDGNGDNAGVLVVPDTLSRAHALGIDPAAALARNDSYGFFSRLEDLVRTGPTRTNVNDFRAIFIAS